MVMERLDAAKRLPENQGEVQQFAIEEAKRLLRAAKVKDTGPKAERISPAQKSTNREIDLNSEWLGQTQKYIDLGFHKELGLTEQEYLDSLPKFTSQPEIFRGRFDIPLVVETRIPIKRQCELAGLEYYLEGLNVRDWPDDPRGYKTPDSPYVVWAQDGTKNLGGEVQDVRENLEGDERGATVFDGVALYIKDPEILKNHYLDLPGTQVGSVNAACLDLWDGRPRLHYRWVGHAYPGFGSVSCGI